MKMFGRCVLVEARKAARERQTLELVLGGGERLRVPCEEGTLELVQGSIA